MLPFLFPFGSGSEIFNDVSANHDSGSAVQEALIVNGGNVSFKVDVNRLNGTTNSFNKQDLRELLFEAEKDSFFTVLVINGEFRGPVPSSMSLFPKNSLNLPAKLNASLENLVIESLPWGEHYEFAVADSQTGFVFFYIEGHQYDYDANQRKLSIKNGRVLISPEFAQELGRAEDARETVGFISVEVDLRVTDSATIFNNQIQKKVLNKELSACSSTNALVPGPDVIVGDVYGLAQFGSAGTQVGLAVGTHSCNAGTIDLNWFQNPSNDHPVIPQNLYRMSGGADNAERFEQIGQSSVKHAFTALTQNLCGFGCNGVGGSRLGSGCSDPYSASLNAGPNLGSRAWINPFTGFFPRNDSPTPNNNHTGHTHTGTSHRILVEMSDLNPSQNPGATYYAEGQYVTPHEYQWCQSNPSQCNMYNNVSYRQYSVSGNTNFTFTPVGNTVREKAAVEAWTGATKVQIQPAPGVDGIGIVAYKVTQPSPGVWHYEYAIYNQNMDRAIGSFSVPTGNGVTLTNIGFYAPPQHPGSSGDGTVGNAGYSSAPWSVSQTSSSITWQTESFTANQNANAIRWGTMYNFRFRSNRPPEIKNATIGFFKTGDPITVPVQAPSAVSAPVRSRADFDGDGKTDLSVFRGSEGNWYLNRSTAGFVAVNFGVNNDFITPGDYDNDGKTDVAVFRPTNVEGQPDFFVLNSGNSTLTGVAWGTTGDIPCVGDYNGDGRTQFCVYRPSNNSFYVLNPDGSMRHYAFGTSGDKIVVGDYDGDGKTDFAVFRPSNGTWYIARSTDNDIVTAQWGLTSDIPVVADYDGDNKDDIAVFRPSNGIWYILRSSGGNSFISFGLNGDVPVPGDYDGDGKDDQAVYRNGLWYMNNSTSGVAVSSFGLATDRPVPRAYLPQ